METNKSHNEKKKLTLNKQTLIQLDRDEAQNVKGGIYYHKQDSKGKVTSCQAGTSL